MPVLGAEPTEIDPEEEIEPSNPSFMDGVRSFFNADNPAAVVPVAAAALGVGILSRGKGAAKPFYSAVEKAVSESKLKAAPGKQWLGTLKNTPGIKQEELDWIGLEDFLGSQKETVSKEQLADFVRSNQVEVQEVVKGARLDDEFDALAMQEYGKRFNELSTVEQNTLRGFHREGWVDESNLPTQASDTKFSQWQLPGGENYQELLLTLPEQKSAKYGVAQGTSESGNSLFYVRDVERGEQISEGYTSQDAAQRYANQLNGGEDRRGAANFKGSHYDEPNVLAHVRFNDRVTPDGKKTLFLEEIQSDWHQKGRKQGYSGPPPQKFVELPEGAELRPALSGERQKSIAAAASSKEYDRVIAAHNEASGVAAGREPNIPQDIVDADARVLEAFSQNSLPDKVDFDKWLTYVRRDVPDAFAKSDPYAGAAGLRGFAVVKDGQRITWARTAEEAKSAALERLYEKALEAHRGGVPDAPFKGQGWEELTLKRMIKYAVDNGYDSVSWTPGKVQALRYENALRQEATGIRWDKSMVSPMGEESKKVVTIGLKKGGDVQVSVDRQTGMVTGGNLPQAQGKSLEEIIGKDMAAAVLEKESGEFANKDFVIGAKFFEDRYDKRAVQIANKLGKKYGAKVGVTQIPKEAIYKRPNGWTIRSADPSEKMTYGLWSTREEAEAFLKSGKPFDEGFVPMRGGQEVWTLPITDKMRAEVGEKGLPLFTAPAAVLGAGALAAEALDGNEDIDLGDENYYEAAALAGLGLAFKGKGVGKAAGRLIGKGARSIVDNPALERALADTRQAAPVVAERLDTIIPQSERVAHGSYALGAPDGRAWSELSPEELAQRGSGFAGDNADLDRLWRETLDEVSEAARQAVARTGATWEAFDADAWDKALRLPLRSQLWYELSGEAFARLLPELSDQEFMMFVDLIGATSARARPGENLERALAVLSQRLRGVPIDVDLTVSSTVSAALKRKGTELSSDLANKTGMFSDTLALVAGKPVRYPISVNDVWVGRAFGISDQQLSSNQALHEVFGKYMNKVRDLVNESGAHPIDHESWQLQARQWVEMRASDEGVDTLADISVEGNDYAGELANVIAKLEKGGLSVPGGIITKDILMNPRFADILRQTTSEFRKAPKATVEFGTLNTSAGRKATELVGAAAAAGYNKPLKEYLEVLTSAMYHSYRGKNTPWDMVVSAALGKNTGLTRISAPTKADPFSVSGTFGGVASPNLRIPLKGLTPDDVAYFNATIGKRLRQDAMAAAQVTRLEHGEKLPPGAVATLSIRFDVDGPVNPDILTDFAAALGEGFEVSAVKNPDGVLMDITPRFGDAGPEGPTRDVALRAIEQMEAKHGLQNVKAFDSAFVSEYGKNYVEASDYDAIIKRTLKRWRDDAIAELKAAGLKPAEAKLYIDGGELTDGARKIRGLAGRAKRVRKTLQKRLDHHAAAEEAFGKITGEIDSRLTDLIPTWERRLSKVKQ